MRLILILMTFMTGIGFSSGLFAANCGGLNQVPCTLFQRDILKFGSCDKGLKEDFVRKICISAGAQAAPIIQAQPRPGHCGRNNQPPCPVSIHYTPCEAPLQLYFGNGRCISPQDIQAEENRKRQRPGNCGRQNQPPCAPSVHYTPCEAPNILQGNGYCNPKLTRPAHCGHQNQRPCAISEFTASCDGGLVEARGQCLTPQDAAPKPAARPPHCGHYQQRPCAVNEFIPACDSGLLEARGQCLTPQDAAPQSATRPQHCGHVNQRPCYTHEYIRPCEKDLYEANGQCLQTGYQPPQSSALIPPQAAQPCAGENQNCAFNGTADVYYGAQNNWTVQTHANGVFCGNTVFGDPIPGVLKSCLVVVTQPGFAAPPPVETYSAPADPGELIPPPYAQPNTTTQAPAAVNNALSRPPRFIHPPIQKIWLHEDCNFKGKRIELAPGVYDLKQLQARGYQDNTLSSISVPYGYEVLLFDREITGFEHINVRRAIRCLDSMNYNDKVSSIAISPLLHVTLYPECYRYKGGSPISQDNSQENEDRIKNSLLLQPGKYLLYQLQDMGFRNDDLSAIRIPPSLEVELFEDDGFQGRSLVLTKTNLCLEKNGFDKRVSSLIVAEAGTLSQKQVDPAPVPVASVADGQKTNQPAPAVAEVFGCKSNEQWRWIAGAVTVESDSRACSPGAATSNWIIQGVAANALRATGVTDDQAGLLTLTVDDAGQRLTLHINHIRSTAPNSSEFRYGIAPDSPLIGAGKWERLQR